MSERIEKIQAMLADEPDSEMLQYMLAMEHRKQGDSEAALAAFDKLQHRDPPHVPSFLMGAQLLADLARTEEARAVLRSGIEAARDQGNSHAAGEMAELLASLGGQV